MTKVRQTEQIGQKHIRIGSSSPFKSLVQAERDDSPVSVITHCAVISQPSSACTSMERCIYQDVKLHTFQDHGYSTSDDDTYFNSGTLPRECLKVGTLESLPETHSLSLNSSPKMGCCEDESRMRILLSKSQISESTHLNSDVCGLHDDSIAKVNTETQIDLRSTYNDGNGLQDKEVLTTSHVHGGPNRLTVTNSEEESCWKSRQALSKDATTEDFKSAEGKECQQEKGLWHQTKGLNTVMLEKAEQHQTKFSNVNNPSGRNILEKIEEGSKKRYGSQGAAMGLMRTCPSPGTPSLIPSRSSFSGVHNYVGYHLFGCNNTGGNGAGKGSRGLHDHVPCQTIKPGTSSKGLPSKWEDAEKWLNNVTDSPCHPKSRVSPPTRSIAPKACHGNMAGKRETSSFQATITVTATGASELSRTATIPGNRYRIISSESDFPTAAQDYRVLVRSTSQKYRQGEKTGRNSMEKYDVVPKNDKVVKNARINGLIDPAIFLEDDGKDSETLSWGHCNNQLLKFGVDVGEQQAFQGGKQQQTDGLAEDKFADIVVETSNREGFNLLLQDEFAVQTSNSERSASMKDAATEISPTMSRRDMATQITPLSSSCTSRSATPIKHESPARHNTPTKQSASCSNAPGISLLELESCHLAKLQLRDLPAGSQFQSFDKSVSNWSTMEEEEEESSKCLRQIDNIGDARNALEARAAAWEEAERMKYSAKCKREEAKIEAWENHQKAKADAELKKLEVKLEKLRSHATERILNKLAAAHRRAEEMRAAAQAQQAEQIAKAADRAAQIQKTGHIPAASFGVCFARLA